MLLKNGNILQIKDSGISFEKADIRILDKAIHETGNLCPLDNEECMDLNGDFVLPGMVNSHYHSYTNIIRGTSFGEPLEIWSSDTVNLGQVLTEEDMELSASLGICQMLRAGVTACVDHLPHLKTACTAAMTYKNSGFKAGLAPMLHNIRDLDLMKVMKNSENPDASKYFPSINEYMDFYEDFICRFREPEGSLQVLLGINSPQRADDKLLEHSSELARKHKLPVHCHLLETRLQRQWADEDISPVKKLDFYGLLGNKTSLAHCIWLNEEEMNLVAARRATVASNPTSNSFLGSGIFPAEQYLRRNINIALGSDGANCGTNHNMLEILRFFLLIQRAAQPDYRSWIDARTAFLTITSNGSKVLDFSRPTGEIKPGYAADLAVADKRSFLAITDEASINELLFHTSHLNFKHISVNGRFLMKDSKITALDEDVLIREIAKKRAHLNKSFTEALYKSSKEKQFYRKAYENDYKKFIL